MSSPSTPTSAPAAVQSGTTASNSAASLPLGVIIGLAVAGVAIIAIFVFIWIKCIRAAPADDSGDAEKNAGGKKTTKDDESAAAPKKQDQRPKAAPVAPAVKRNDPLPAKNVPASSAPANTPVMKKVVMQQPTVLPTPKVHTAIIVDSSSMSVEEAVLAAGNAVSTPVKKSVGFADYDDDNDHMAVPIGGASAAGATVSRTMTERRTELSDEFDDNDGMVEPVE